MITIADRLTGPAASAGTGSGGRRAVGTPVWVIQLYVVLLVLIPPTEIIEPLGAAGTPATLVGLVAFLQWAVAVLRPGDNLARTVVPVRAVMGLFFGTVLLRYAVMHIGAVPYATVTSSDVLLIRMVSWAGVALLAAEGLRDRDEITRVLRTLVGVVAVMAVVGFLQFRAGIDLTVWPRRIPVLHENADLITIQDRGGFRRPAGTATHPIEFGCVIAMVLPLALHLGRFDVVRSQVRRWLPVALIAIGIPAAVSRSAILGALVAGIVIFLGIEPRLRPKALMSVAVFLTLIYATTPGLLGTLRGFFLSTGSDSRTEDYGPALAHIRSSPWFGHGPGSFIADSDIGNVLDNQYLVTLIEVGIIGLLILLVYLLAAAFLGRGARHRSSDPATRDLGQALAAASISSAATTYTFDALAFRMFAGIIPLCLGIAGVLWYTTRAGERSGEHELAAAVSPSQAGGAEVPLALEAAFTADPPADHGDRVLVPIAEADLPEETTIIDLSDAAGARDDPGSEDRLRVPPAVDADLAEGSVDDVDLTLELPETRESGAGVHDLRRVAVLICSGAAVFVLLGLPFLVDRRDGGQVAQVGIPSGADEVPLDDLDTTIVDDGSSKSAARSQSQAQAGRSSTTVRRSTTTLPGRSGTGSVTTRPPLGGSPTTAPPGPTVTTAPPPATTEPPTPTTEPPPTTETTTTTDTTTPTTVGSGGGLTDVVRDAVADLTGSGGGATVGTGP